MRCFIPPIFNANTHQHTQVMREALLAISGKGEKEGQEGPLLPVEHHAMQVCMQRSVWWYV